MNILARQVIGTADNQIFAIVSLVVMHVYDVCRVAYQNAALCVVVSLGGLTNCREKKLPKREEITSSILSRIDQS